MMPFTNSLYVRGSENDVLPAASLREWKNTSTSSSNSMPLASFKSFLLIRPSLSKSQHWKVCSNTYSVVDGLYSIFS